LIKPLYLLADSQLLFSREPASNLTAAVRAHLTSPNPKAAYIGASNHDRTEFYDLFVAAMQGMKVSRCRMVRSLMTREDRLFMEEADLILLAGGEAVHGWQVFERNGLKELLLRKHHAGGLLMGVSAGAIQLGLGALTDEPQPKKLDTFGFAPFYVGAHEEEEDWRDLRALVNLSAPGARGIGLPTGGGAIYWPDGTLEPVRLPLTELVKEGDELRERLLPFNPSVSI
jgi:peptidase E